MSIKINITNKEEMNKITTWYWDKKISDIQFLTRIDKLITEIKNNSPVEAMVILKIAEYAHDAWSGWMKYLFSKCTNPMESGTITIPRWAVERWERQMNTKYADLSEEEKATDKEEAKKILKIISNFEV